MGMLLTTVGKPIFSGKDYKGKGLIQLELRECLIFIFIPSQINGPWVIISVAVGLAFRAAFWKEKKTEWIISPVAGVLYIILCGSC